MANFCQVFFETITAAHLIHSVFSSSSAKKVVVSYYLIFSYYRVVKQNLQVVRFCDFEHMRARMAQFFYKTSRHNIYLLIQSKKLRSKAKTSPESQKRPRVSDLVCAPL